MTITNQTKNTVIARNVCLADRFVARLTGLLNRKHLPEGEALIITRCNSIHTFFMRFAIDVIFINAHNEVVGLVEKIKPFRLSPIFFKAARAIELAPGTITQTKTTLGDTLTL